MGLGVYNTRDEPNGLNQGIQRARKRKRNPKTYGAAKGFLPNFAPEEEASVDVRFGLEGLADEVKAELITALDKVRHGTKSKQKTEKNYRQQQKTLLVSMASQGHN